MMILSADEEMKFLIKLADEKLNAENFMMII